MGDLTSQRVGRFQVEQKLGVGGMATVYRARDPHLERDVAIKIIRVDQFPAASLEQILKRFDREARALARLTHPNIVGVIDFGKYEETPYLVMEYLPGGSLQNLMGAAMPFSQAAHIVAVIARALNYAHAQGIVHRDVKPSNILLTASGDPMLSDFGIAKILEVEEGSAALTGSGFMIGTPDYMAPEQWAGNSSPASDQYSLGLILYELVTGRKPYTAATPAELLIKQATQPLPLPREFVRDLSVPAEQSILRALAKDPRDRYPDMNAFAAALDSLAPPTQLAPVKPPQSWVSSGRPPFPPPAKRPAPPVSMPQASAPAAQKAASLGQASVPPASARASQTPQPAQPALRAPGQTPTPAPAPVKRGPLLLLGGGLLVAGLFVIGIFAGGLAFAYSQGWFKPTAAPTATQESIQTGPAVPSPAGPTAVSGATSPDSSATPTSPALPAAVETLRVNLDAAPDNLDPQKASVINEIDHLRLMYEGLTRLDEKLATVPGAAENWKYNQDATQLTFILRKGLKYSDGTLLNAKRFEYSILRNIDPATGGDYASITDEIQGAPAWRNADLSKTSQTDQKKLKDAVGVKALDSLGKPCTGYNQPDCLTLVVQFSHPAPYFHTVMSLWVAFPVREELIAQGGENWWKTAANHAGNGPMILDALEADTRARFKPNPNYWRGTARVNIEFRYGNDTASAFQAYQKGELDIVSLGAAELATAQSDLELNKQVMIYPGSCTTSLEFNEFKEPFNDKAARQAFAYSIDRESWVKDVIKGLGYPTRTWIPKGFPGYDAGESRFPYDPAKTKSLLESAGYKIQAGQLAKNGKAIPLNLTYPDNPTNRAEFEWIANRWQIDLGLKTKLNPVDADTYSNISSDNSAAPPFYIYGWCADYPDPQNWLSVYWKSGTYFAQRIGFEDQVFDKMVDQADAELDGAKRIRLYVQAQQQLIGQVPGVMLYTDLYAYLVRPSVKGILPTAQDAGWPGSIDPLTITMVK